MFLLALAVFWVTAAPGLGPGHDSGELTCVAYFRGVAHPPGYPLYAHLAHLWGRVCPGDYAWRINLFSGLGVAAAAGFLSSLVWTATASRSAAWMAGLGFAWLRSCWNQAVVAEVFGLHLALMAYLGWSGQRAVAALREDKPRQVWLWAFYAGLGLAIAHHHTIVLALPGLLWMGWVALGRRSWRLLITPAWFLALGLALFFYLEMMFRAQDTPLANWGNPSEWGRLRDHFLRRAYGTFRLTAVAEPFEQGLTHGWGFALFTYVRQGPWAWMLLATLGAGWGRRLHPPLWSLAWGWLLAFGPFFALIGRQKIDAFHLDMLERFYASSYLGLAILAGLGWLRLTRLRPGLVWLTPLILIWSGWANLANCRLDGRDLTGTYARTVLAAPPRGALLIVTGDLPVGALDYVHKVEGQRPDLDLVCPGLVGGSWYRDQCSPRVQGWLQGAAGNSDAVAAHLARAAHQDGVAVYFNQQLNLNGIWRPRNLSLQWHPPGSALEDDSPLIGRDLDQALRQSWRLEPGLGGEDRFWPRYLISSHLRSLRFLAAHSFQRQPHKALAAMERVLHLGGDRALDYLNRGLLLQGLGRHPAALRDFEEALRRQPQWKLAEKAREVSLRFSPTGKEPSASP